MSRTGHLRCPYLCTHAQSAAHINLKASCAYTGNGERWQLDTKVLPAPCPHPSATHNSDKRSMSFRTQLHPPPPPTPTLPLPHTALKPPQPRTHLMDRSIWLLPYSTTKPAIRLWSMMGLSLMFLLPVSSCSFLAIRNCCSCSSFTALRRVATCRQLIAQAGGQAPQAAAAQ